MRRSWLFWIWLALSDAIIINLGYYIAFRVRFGQNIPQNNIGPFLTLIPYITLFVLVFFWFFELYSGTWKRNLETLYSVVITVLLLNMAIMALTFFLRGFSFPRSIFILAAALQIIMLGAWRLLWQILWGRMQGGRTVAVIGNDGAALAYKLRVLIGRQYQLVSSFDAESEVAAAVDPASRDGKASKVISELEKAEIVCISPSLSRDAKQAIISWCLEEDKDVVLIPDLYDILLHNAILNRVEDQPVFLIESLSLTPGQQIFKRLCDLAASSLALVICLPFFLIIASAIKLSSKGPVFYLQQRVGMNGRLFSPIKFRTMIDNAEDEVGPVMASRDDPRITSIGRILRPLRLDELPQLINVLKGEMSLVGPRPERPVFVEEFHRTIPGYNYRLKVKPGITGLAQVQGRYDTDVMGKLSFDLYYIHNYSLFLDLQIILQTMRVVLMPDAAKGIAKRG